MNILTYNGQKIEQRIDGYVNATQMAQANGKLVADWLRLASTKDYIQELAVIVQIPITELSRVNKGGKVDQSGTWLHPLLALNFGRWISPKFAIWCDQHIKTLMETGSTSISKPKLLLPVESGRYLEDLIAIKETIDKYRRITISAIKNYNSRFRRYKNEELLLMFNTLVELGLVVKLSSSHTKFKFGSLLFYNSDGNIKESILPLIFR